MIAPFKEQLTAVRRIGRHLVFVPQHCHISRKSHKQLRQWLRSNKFDFVYGDSTHPTHNKFEEPVQVYRPDWSPERLRGHCYVGEVISVDPQVVARAGGENFLASLSAHDRALRLSEVATSPARAPIFLYSSPWECRIPSVDLDAVRSHCERTGIVADCHMNPDQSGVAVIRRRNNQPTVCVIVPTRGTMAEIYGKNVVLAAHAIRSLIAYCNYQNFEIIVVADTDTPASSIEEIKSVAPERLRVIPYDREFNFSEKVNLAAVQTTAEYLLFLNDDTEVAAPNLLDVMLSYFQDPTVGMVGPTLLYEDGSLQSAGHFFNPVPYDLYRKYAATSAGAYNMLRVTREVSSVIAACALTPREAFLEVGGLSALFPGNYNDIDYSLKLQMTGKRVLWTPFTECFHFESKTREPIMKPADVAALGARWRDKLENDPYGHPALQRYQPIWKANRPGQRSLDEAVGPTAPIASK